MKRHRDREIAVSTLYSLDFNNSMELTDDIDLFQGMSEEEVASLCGARPVRHALAHHKQCTGPVELQLHEDR